jgi:flagellum-specific peptidoglycan hydrolase FlgJ
LKYRETYNGVNGYRKKKSKGKIRRFFLKSIFFIICIFSIFSIVLTFINKNGKNISLSHEVVLSYINVADELSKEGYQLNWQEIAAINGAVNEGEFNINNKDQLNSIGKAFLKKNSSNDSIGLRNFDSAIKELKLDEKEEKLAEDYLIELKKNYLHSELDKEKIQFIEKVSDGAYKNYKNYGILPSITIGQAILESGWGESELSSRHNNIFGIKADASWSEEKVNMKTKENYKDVIVGDFRAYNNISSSIEDHGKFLWENERYAKNGLFEAKNYRAQAQVLEDAGYSTAKDENGNLIYGDKLIRVIQENNLMIYDTKVQRGE